MQQLVEQLEKMDWPLLVVGSALVFLIVLFAVFYVVPGMLLAMRLRSMKRSLRSMQSEKSINPRTVAIKDVRLRHLWNEYCETLHPETATDSQTGLIQIVRHRATLPAEAYFSSASVVDGRLHVEFFKHLPGLLTGIGIIGTFLGLIHGLDDATVGKELNPTKLIDSVREAFYVSATAIIAAMVITFVEKVIVSWLHAASEGVCHAIDSQFAAGAGEEYLARLVVATEQAATHSAQLKDSLVGELRDILERLTDRQIEASAKQQAQFTQHLATSLQQPLEGVVNGLRDFGSAQNTGIAQGFQDQMSAFAAKLDEVLGGQIGQAKDLQFQTLRGLEAAVAAFKGAADNIGAAGDTALGSMGDKLNRALDDISSRQLQMNDAMRSFIDDLRVSMGQTHSDTSTAISGLMEQLSTKVFEAVTSLQSQVSATTKVASDHQSQISEAAQRSIEALAAEVRSQTQTIETVSTAMRGAVSDLTSTVDRTILRITDGAQTMTVAAQEFARSGQGIVDVLDRSSNLSRDLAHTGAALAMSSQDISKVVSDYRAARETFQGIVDTLRATVETARREASLTADVLSRIEASAQTLASAQGQADEYLLRLNEVLADAHSTFSNQMLDTVRKTNGDFHKHLKDSTSLLAGTVAELEGTLIQIQPRRARVVGETV